ncbi:hypothetical protein Tco_1278564, partial [Tanacetum coccineum]
ASTFIPSSGTRIINCCSSSCDSSSSSFSFDSLAGSEFSSVFYLLELL